MKCVALLVAFFLSLTTIYAQNNCMCTPQYNPVCGSDGVPYSNTCYFECARLTNPGLTISHMGTCSRRRGT